MTSRVTVTVAAAVNSAKSIGRTVRQTWRSKGKQTLRTRADSTTTGYRKRKGSLLGRSQGREDRRPSPECQGNATSRERVLILAPLYDPAYLGGGPIRTLLALVDSAPSNFEIAVMAGDRDLGAAEPLSVERNAWTDRGRAVCYYVTTDSPPAILRAAYTALKSRPDMVYCNSFLSPIFGILPQLLARVGVWRRVQVLLAPRGELNVGALAIDSHKKACYIAVYRLLGLHRRVVWHASSEDEAKAIQRLFGPVRVVVREDETSLPAEAIAPIARVDEQERLRLVFLARISPIKGLHILLSALRCVSQPMLLDIYGPKEDQGYFRECEESLLQVAGSVTARFCGTVHPTLVRKVLADYELLVLPTGGENFGHSIAESLSVSCPVMCADTTPWSEVLRRGGGVVVPASAPYVWSQYIDEYASFSPAERLRRRHASGLAYRDWRVASKGPHIFSSVSIGDGGL